MHINELLQIAVTSGASDLHLKVGSYPMMRVSGTLVVANEEKRLERADTVVYLDYPIRLCLWRALRRAWRYRGAARPDMAPGCPERFDPAFFLYILTFRRGPRRRTEDRLRAHAHKVRRFAGPRALRRWMDGLGQAALAKPAALG